MHMCRSRANFACRHLIIGDAMAVVLALTKGRSSSSVLLSICRQWCAYTLAADIYPHVRWVPSQRNAADDSYRNRSRHLVDSDVAETQISLWAAGKTGNLPARPKVVRSFTGALSRMPPSINAISNQSRSQKTKVPMQTKTKSAKVTFTPSLRHSRPLERAGQSDPASYRRSDRSYCRK